MLLELLFSRLAALVTFGVSAGDLVTLTAQCTTSATASRESTAAETEATTAERDSSEAANLVVEAELSVTTKKNEKKNNDMSPAPAPANSAGKVFAFAAPLACALAAMIVV
mmetsp:Transcript_26334/g.42206  ORF Transcript_26334/g.42206 Transcript_26334/m.42206 type:complete len:111 (-) Transcript_26334:397-729(-)